MFRVLRLLDPRLFAALPDRLFRSAIARWIVERAFAWLGNYRRLARAYEISPRTSEAWIKIVMIHLMLRRPA